MFAHKDKLKAFNAGAMNVSKPQSKDNKRKKEQEEEEARAAVYKEFVDSFNDTGTKTRTWVKGGTVNPSSSSASSGNNSSSSSRLYKPGGGSGRFERSYPSSSHSNSSSGREPISSSKESSSSISSSSFAIVKPFQHHPARKGKGEKRSNLELFKEELKIMQEQRDHRHAMKNYLKELQESQSTDKPRKSRFEPVPPPLPPSLARGVAPPMDLDYPMDFDTDKSTTNIFLGNLNPEMGEQRLMEVFGRYGPLASIKIMWPRNDDERSRGRNCGFVAFMHRKDAERAMTMLRGRDVYNFEMKMGWGKGVPIPVQPVYVPPRLLELIKPPPSSGLPFNAQPREWLQRQHDRAHAKRSRSGEDERQRPIDTSSLGAEEFDKTIKEAVVKVVIPTERPLIALINRMVEFVVREGPVFEAIIMNREMNNPQFNFLFEYQTPEHVYYRWKLFSILNGDAANHWRSEDFRLFQNGSLWRPPPMNVFTSGMPDELVDDDGMDIGDEHDSGERSPRDLQSSRGRRSGLTADDSDEEPGSARRSSSLSERQREHLEKQLKELSPERSKIGELMVWCLNHADAAREIAECIGDHLSPMNTPLDKKLARLFLISDILYNCGKVPKTSLFRRCFEELLEDIFHDMCEYHQSLDGRLKAEQFKQKVMLCFRVWEDWSIYTNEFLIRLQNVFLGLTKKAANGAVTFGTTVEVSPSVALRGEHEADIDGEVLDGRPLVDYDGDPLDGLPLQESAAPSGPPGSAEKRKRTESGGPTASAKRRRRASANSDSDSLEASGDRSAASRGAFLASKWETVDPEVVQAQAVTSSKWDLFEDAGGDEGEVDGEDMAAGGGDDFDGEPLSGLGASNPISLVSYDDDEDDDEEDLGGGDSRRGHHSLRLSSSGRSRRRSGSQNAEEEEGEEGEDTSSSGSNSPEPSMGPSSVIVTPTSASASASAAAAAGSTSSLSELRRAKLRELELKVVKYQDDLEAGRRARKAELSLSEQVEAYRQKLYQRESRHLERKQHRHRRRGGGVSSANTASPSSRRRARGSRSRSRSRGASSSRQRGGASEKESGEKRGAGGSSLNLSSASVSSKRSAGDERSGDRGSRTAPRTSRSRRSRSRSPRTDRDRERDRDRDRERDSRRSDRHSRR